MPYATPTDMKARYPEKDLRELTDENAEAINDGMLTTALSDVSAVIDGYLRGRYQLPLTDIPVELTVVACDMAMYKLQALRPQNAIEDAEKRNDKAMAWLRDVSRGTVQLGLSTIGTAPAQTDGPKVIGGHSTFTRDDLRRL